jgi:hypothetical protein
LTLLSSPIERFVSDFQDLPAPPLNRRKPKNRLRRIAQDLFKQEEATIRGWLTLGASALEGLRSRQRNPTDGLPSNKKK